MSTEALLITVTGADKPGITAKIAALLATGGLALLDVEQVVVQGNLNLTFVVDAGPATLGTQPILKDLLWSARELGMVIDFRFATPPEAKPVRHAWALTLVSTQVTAAMLATAAEAAAARGFNIDRIGRLSGARLASIELILSKDATSASRAEADEQALKTDLLALQSTLGCDVALQREGLTRRSKRLVVMDMDSTLIKQEVIDELARKVGVYDQVASITHRAMNGELDFDGALRERVALLAGAPASILDEVIADIELTPGAENLVRVLKRLGYRLAVISGGFIQVTEPLRQRLGLDYAFANDLEIEGGKLTGRVVGPIVNRQRKADLLESLAQAERVSLDQVIAIGDGANDLDMLHRAGLGIAFNAKQVVREQADYAINQRNLDAILYLLGITDADAGQV
jgi:phosphoserine phosphatase